jgi:hypothetical protein
MLVNVMDLSFYTRGIWLVLRRPTRAMHRSLGNGHFCFSWAGSSGPVIFALGGLFRSIRWVTMALIIKFIVLKVSQTWFSLAFSGMQLSNAFAAFSQFFSKQNNRWFNSVSFMEFPLLIAHPPNKSMDLSRRLHYFCFAMAGSRRPSHL